MLRPPTPSPQGPLPGASASVLFRIPSAWGLVGRFPEYECDEGRYGGIAETVAEVRYLCADRRSHTAAAANSDELAL